jgi:membrane protein DedA with SNARE-associated domain
VPTATGIKLLVVIALLALATLVSEDLTCIAAGLLVAQGQIGFVAATFACAFGIFVGDLLLFWAGRALGRPWVRRRPLSWVLSPEKIDSSSEWFRHKGPTVIFLSRFVPGSRLPTYFTAGLLHTSFWKFVLYFGIAVLAWTPILVGVSSLAGARALAWFGVFERYALLGFAALVFTVWILVWLLRNLLTHRGRRLLAGRIRKWTHWEFWPAWVFYLPVVLWVLWLGIRNKRLALFTAANPAMPLGGFVGESKWAILESLPRERVARTQRIEASAGRAARIEAVRALVLESTLYLPVVIKPDVGERGSGVTVARSWPEVEVAVSEARGDLLVQEYVPGIEIGVFYTRLPGERHGSIFSITEKVLPVVAGNGISSLEDLVLSDSRAVMIADVYLDRLEADRHRIPEAGESVLLTDLGTHCKGAIFLDGQRFFSDELLKAVDEIARSYDGFFFGRFDLRGASESDLCAGRFKVIELNGVTSEATHIYDPSNSLVEAYKVLFRQWRLAFETGRRNVERGARPGTVIELFRAIMRKKS